MKARLLALVLFAPWLAQAQTPFTVKGTIGQLNAPAKIYLFQGMQPTDSATFKYGTFEFKGTTDLPKPAELLIKRNGKLESGLLGFVDATRIYLEPGLVVITSADSLKNARLQGGPVTSDYQRLQTALKPLLAKQKALGAEYQQASAQQRETPAFKARMQALGQALFKDYAQGTAAFIKANPTSWVSLYSLQGMSQPQYADVGPLYEALSPKLKTSAPGRRYGELVNRLKAVAVGAQAPAFRQQTPAGNTVSLADYRGKYVLLDFWASWCGPCREENPAVTKVYNDYKGRNFDILSVSLDDEKGRAKWLKAIEDDHLAWTQVSDLKGWQNEAARLYNVQGIPQNFLIDPTGKIVAFNLKGADLRTTLARYIK
ncbi:redoxin domain-containing protein [uncultured Hymenobacter sp.]|uniref:redoxin domain-containing protein n=1 Tax=uncultured Hymenobacter sp. TaxID=170016 RepID=UPI0035CBFEB3